MFQLNVPGSFPFNVRYTSILVLAKSAKPFLSQNSGINSRSTTDVYYCFWFLFDQLDVEAIKYCALNDVKLVLTV